MTVEEMAIPSIHDLLPHRYPFLLVDRIVEVNLDEDRIMRIKNVSFNEHFFQGHFPEMPIMPGVLILEAMAQLGAALVRLKGGDHDKIAVMMNVNSAKFRHPVKPGDVLTLHGEGLHFSSRAGKIRGRALVGDKLAAEAEVSFALVDRAS